MQLNFTVGDQETTFREDALSGYRLATWLPTGGSLSVVFQAVFEDRVPPNDALYPGRPPAQKLVAGVVPFPAVGATGEIALQRIEAAGTSSIVLRGMTLVDPSDRRLSGEGYQATLITFRTSKGWADNLHAVPDTKRMESTCLNSDELADIQYKSGGLFTWGEPPGFNAAASPGAPAPLTHLVLKPLSGDLDTSGSVLAFRTERTRENDPIPMILRQFCSKGFELDLTYEFHTDSKLPRCQIGSAKPRKPIIGLLYEQVWGRFRRQRCLTSQRIQRAIVAKTPNDLLISSLDDVIPREGESAIVGEYDPDPKIEERMAFVFANDVDWP